jgi:hypothetical protein
MAPWTLAAVYESAAAQYIDPWTAIKKASQECGDGTSSCPGPYPMAAVSRGQNELVCKFKMAAGDMISIRGQFISKNQFNS